MAHIAENRPRSAAAGVAGWVLWWQSHGGGAVAADCWLGVAAMWAATDSTIPPLTALVVGIPLVVTLAVRI